MVYDLVQLRQNPAFGSVELKLQTAFATVIFIRRTGVSHRSGSAVVKKQDLTLTQGYYGHEKRIQVAVTS